MELNKNIKEKIKEIALSKPNEEVCGFVYEDLEGKVVVESAANQSDDKEKFFKISPAQYKAVILKSKNIIGVFHSHAKGDSTPSDFDKIMVEHTQLPFIIYGNLSDTFSTLIPE